MRWRLAAELLQFADALERVDDPASPVVRNNPQRSAETIVGRWTGGVDSHHHDIMQEYVTPEETGRLHHLMQESPATRGRASMKRVRKARAPIGR